MDTSDYIAILALIVSILSLGVSFYFGYRDKVNLRATCKFFPDHPEYNRAHLSIKVVNHGRRPAIITLFGGYLQDGGWQGTYLRGIEGALRLGEHEFHEDNLYKEVKELITD